MSRVWKADELTLTAPWRPMQDRVPTARTDPAPICDEQVSEVMERARRQAEQIIASARSEAESILADAERQAEDQKQAGYEEGLKAGRVAGERAAKIELQKEFEVLQRERENLIEKDRALLVESEAELVEMALLVASRVIGYHLRTDDEAVQSSLRQVLAAATGARSALLRVSADDFDHLWPRRQEWVASIPGLKEFEIESDPRLQKGDLMLQSNLGTIDARVETILAQVADQLGSGGEL